MCNGTGDDLVEGTKAEKKEDVIGPKDLDGYRCV
eukprot:CAMPEP_0113549598 /NCGR_PEP_ID=MMETSP0015_2-20120614/13520_1 /TAXON_ID=2838 /ORGANISM="Odontella" /LENGTH=33 /DNA_ID=CAMNT_0000450321 /DNA_START=583 /DNA_END=684 /DNA_ORIENTATION=- /assembly_acc=CAM_ASM_000160